MSPNIFNSNFTFHSVSSPYMGINQYSIRNVLNLREWSYPTHTYLFLLRIFSMECHPTVPFPSPYQGNKHTNSVFCCDQFEIQQSIYLTLQTNNSPHCTLFLFVFWTISDLSIGQLLFCSTLCSSLFPQLLKNTFFLLLFSTVFSAYGPPSLPSKRLLFHISPILHLLPPFSQLNKDSTNSWRMTRSLKKHNIFRS